MWTVNLVFLVFYEIVTNNPCVPVIYLLRCFSKGSFVTFCWMQKKSSWQDAEEEMLGLMASKTNLGIMAQSMGNLWLWGAVESVLEISECGRHCWNSSSFTCQLWNASNSSWFHVWTTHGVLQYFAVIKLNCWTPISKSCCDSPSFARFFGKVICVLPWVVQRCSVWLSDRCKPLEHTKMLLEDNNLRRQNAEAMGCMPPSLHMHKMNPHVVSAAWELRVVQ